MPLFLIEVCKYGVISVILDLLLIIEHKMIIMFS